MPKFQASDLVINKDGSVYHLSLKPQNIADTILTVGDPGRVHRVSRYFDSIDFEMNKREFITHTGKYKGRKITVMSTGMGTSNIEILMTELDLLANFDFRKKEYKSKKKKLNIIRLGTSGSMQADLDVGSILLSEKAVGFDNLMAFYNYEENPENKAFSKGIHDILDLAIIPYTADADQDLLNQYKGDPFVSGITITSPGFYGPQGRELNIKLREPKLIEKLSYFSKDNRWLTNFEMETSSYYAFASMLGHRALSVNAIIANRIKGTFSDDTYKTVDQMIEIVLSRF